MTNQTTDASREAYRQAKERAMLASTGSSATNIFWHEQGFDQGWYAATKQPMLLSEDEAIKIADEALLDAAEEHGIGYAESNCTSIIVNALLAATSIKPTTYCDDEGCEHYFTPHSHASIKPTSDKCDHLWDTSMSDNVKCCKCGEWKRTTSDKGE